MAYNFRRLITKYSITPVYISNETAGHNDYDNGGIWVPGATTWAAITGAAAIPISDRDLKYDNGGTYTTEDYKLFAYDDFEDGLKVLYKDQEYTLKKIRDYSDFDAGLMIYAMKRGSNP